MPGEIVTKEIGGRTYHMEPLGSKAQAHVALRVGRPMLNLLKVTDRAGFNAGIADALRDISADDFDFVAGKFAEQCSVDWVDPKNGATSRQKMKVVYDQAFSAAFEVQLEWIYWGLEVNFGAFLGEVRGLLARVPAASASSSPTDATGTTGDSSSPTA